MPQDFPQIGLYAVLELGGFNRSIARYFSQMRNIDRITKQTARNVSKSGQQMGSGFAQNIDELVQKSQLLQDLLQVAPPAVLNPLREAFDDLSEGVGINAQRFDELVESGVPLQDAFQQAQQNISDVKNEAGAASETVTVLGRSFTTTATSVALITASLGAAIRLVQRSISEYNDLAEATRQLRYQTGLASEEASSWVLAIQASGASAATSQRALTGFLDKVAETSREQALGEESSSQFAEALNILGVELKDSDNNLKTTSELLSDVDAAFKRLGPGAQSASAAQALFGYSGRFLLPILLSERTSLEDLNQIAKDYGGTLNGLSQKEYEEFKKAQFELLVALQGVFNHIAKQWTPVLTEVQRIVAASISIWRTFVQIMTGTKPVANTLADVLNMVADVLHVVNQLMQIGANFAQRYRDALRFWSASSREAAQAEEERAQAMAQAAQRASEARAIEEKRQKAIQETILALDEVRAKYVEKLNDIDQDAARKWDDILVKRQRDAIDRARQETFKLIDLQAAYNQRLDDIEADFAKRWDDILVKRQRDALLRGLRLAFQYEDLARSAEKSRQDAIRDAADKEAKLRRDQNRRIADAERDAQRKREELERDHQRRLRDIQQDFLDTVEEAARRNDAVAVARAQRERARDIRDEQQRYADERSDLAESLRQKREDLARDRAEREQDQKDELARTLQRIDENYALQREELVRQNERERLLRDIRYQWELEDFNAAKAEQLQAAEDQYNKQLDALKLAQAREQLERDIQYKRQKEDFDKAQQQRLDDAEAWYAKERDALAEHLSLTGQQLEAIYAEWAQQAAAAAAEVARAASDALAGEIERYQHLLTEAERARARAFVPGAAAPAPALPPVKAPFSVGPYPGAPLFGMAEGGVVQANSPTHILMGEAGPETGVFLPGGGSRSMNVNHNFGRLGVDFQGLPGGMNTQQVQGIVYATMVQLAKGIQVPR